MKAIVAALMLCTMFVSGCATPKPATEPRQAVLFVGPTTSIAQTESEQDEIVAALRGEGQAGLDTVIASNATLIADIRAGRVALDDDTIQAARSTIDAIAQQRDAYASGLYWYTDLDAAKAEAARTGKRILSLRLLGKLDEEYSCANSRFFRTVLYANSDVSKHLRAHYVLHWKTVRPAPLVTIDMGDGRRLKRTITGNSIHYVLNADGTVIDALPGLYGPHAFLAALARSEAVASLDAQTLHLWHEREADSLCRQWLADAVHSGIYSDDFTARFNSGRDMDLVACLGEAFPELHVLTEAEWNLNAMPPVNNIAPVPQSAQQVVQSQVAPANPAPTTQPTTTHEDRINVDPSLPEKPEATAALRSAIAKSMVERPINQQIQRIAPAAAPTFSEPTAIPAVSGADREHRPLADRMTGPVWSKLAQLHSDDARLDESSRRLMMAKLPRQTVSDKERESGGVVDKKTPFALTLNKFEDAIAQDTVRNEYVFHSTIHRWLGEDSLDHAPIDVETLNKRIYSEMFLTPDYDVWLGLVPDNTYTALENDGCACDKGAAPMK